MAVAQAVTQPLGAAGGAGAPAWPAAHARASEADAAVRNIRRRQFRKVQVNIGAGIRRFGERKQAIVPYEPRFRYGRLPRYD